MFEIEPDGPYCGILRGFLYVLAGNTTMTTQKALVGIIMGSDSDWPTLQHAASCLEDFAVNYEAKVVSAHRTPQLMMDYAEQAVERGLQLIIAGAGGAAHLPGMVAAVTVLPVIGVPVMSKALRGMDSLLSIAQMPAGIPVATMSIGDAGARNAGLLAVSILANQDADLRKKLMAFREQQKNKIESIGDPST